MTIKEALALVDELKPNGFSPTVKIRWLSELDGMIYQGLVQTHEGNDDIENPHYTAETDLDTTLIAEHPYDRLYVTWLESRIDYYNYDIAMLNNSNAAFQTEYQEYAAWYNRTYRPLGEKWKFF